MVQTQSANHIPVSMNASWKKFLQQKVNSFIKWDLIRFFHDNPHTADTADNIAHYVGRDARVIARELDDMVRTNVLISQATEDFTIYRLSTEAATRKLINDFVDACHDREFRVQAIHYVISGMGKRTGQATQ